MAENNDTLRFETDDLQVACGERLRFQLVPADGSGCTAETSFFDVQLGEKVHGVGLRFREPRRAGPWIASTSTAATGDWVRGDPLPTELPARNDVSEPGVNCWYTAPNPSGGIGTDDVDDGVTVLLSPSLDLSSLDRRRSFPTGAGSPTVTSGEDAGDFFKAEVSATTVQAGSTSRRWTPTTVAPSWTQRSFKLERVHRAHRPGAHPVPWPRTVPPPGT